MKFKKIIVGLVAVLIVVLAYIYLNADVQIYRGGLLMNGDIGEMLSKQNPEDKNWKDGWFEEREKMLGHVNYIGSRFCVEYHADLDTGGVKIMIYDQNLQCVCEETFTAPCKVRFSKDLDPTLCYGIRLLFKNGTTGKGCTIKETEYIKRWRSIIGNYNCASEEKRRMSLDFAERFSLEFDPYVSNEGEYP